MFKHFFGEKDLTARSDEVWEQMEKTVNKKISMSGRVTLTLNQHEADDTDINVYGCIIEGQGLEKTRNFMQQICFDSNSKTDIMKIIETKENRLLQELEKEQIHQRNLPKNFQDNSKMDQIKRKLAELEFNKQNTVTSEVFGTDTLVVTCGRFIKFGRLDESMFDDDLYSKNEFNDINVELGPDFEISKIWSTSVRNHIQIVAKDAKKRVMIVITWDLDQNIEASMFQYEYKAETRPENYVVKGMNQKYNYFVNENQIIDLEHNIPL